MRSMALVRSRFNEENQRRGMSCAVLALRLTSLE